MDRRKERVAVDTDRYRVHGNVTLPSEGQRSSLSDLLNRGERAFLPLTEAVVKPFDGTEDWSTPVLLLGCRHVRLIPHDGP